MRRFLGLWGLLSATYLVAAALSSWLVLDFLDLTYEAYAAWLLVPVAQAAALRAASLRRPFLPAGRPPLAAALPVALSVPFIAEGLRRPLNVRWGFLVPGSLQAYLPRLLVLAAGAAFLAAAARARGARARLVALGLALVGLGLDAAFPFLGGLPSAVLPRLGPFLGGLVVYGTLLSGLFAAALSAQEGLEPRDGWAPRLLGVSLALLFAAVQGALLQLFLHPWLEKPWSLLVPATVSLSAAFAAAAGLAAALRRGESA